MDLTIAYWNLAKNKKVATAAIELAISAAMDGCVRDDSFNQVVIYFSEIGEIDLLSMEKSLKNLSPTWWVEKSSNDRFAVISNIDQSWINLGDENHNGTAWPMEISLPLDSEIISIDLWPVHLSSPFGKMNPLNHSSFVVRQIKQSIDKRLMQNPLAIIVGDTNQDPYSAAMIDPYGMNAVMCKRIAEEKVRVLNGSESSIPLNFLYNPTWRLLGDRTSLNQPGSFYNTDTSDAAYWHAIDQILMSPDMIKYFVDDQYKYLTKIGLRNIMTSAGVPMKDAFSDHLPLISKWSFQ